MRGVNKMTSPKMTDLNGVSICIGDEVEAWCPPVGRHHPFGKWIKGVVHSYDEDVDLVTITLTDGELAGYARTCASANIRRTNHEG